MQKMLNQIESFFQSKFGKYYRFVLYLVLVVLINLVGISLFFHLDLTSQQIYSLSDASKKVVSTLSEPLTIKVFFTKDLPAPYNGIERYLRDLLQEYSINGNNYFNYSFYNLSAGKADTPKEREIQGMAKDYGINPVQVRTLDKDEVKFQQAFMGMVIIHGNVIKRFPSVSSTEGLEYLITSSIQKMNNRVSALLNVPGQIETRLYLSSGIYPVAPYLNLSQLIGKPRQIEEQIRLLNDKSHNKLKFSYTDPTGKPGIEKELKDYRLLALNWPGFTDRKLNKHFNGGQAYIGMVLKYGERSEAIQLLRIVNTESGKGYELISSDELEERVNGAIESLLDINQKIGYLSDHFTLPLFDRSPEGSKLRNPDAVTHFQQILAQSYSIKEFMLKGGQLPDGVQSIILAGPKEPFTDSELYQLDQFLMQGKSLAIFLDSYNELVMPGKGGFFGKDQSSQFLPVNTGLERLLEHYGITMNNKYVLDENCYVQELETGGKVSVYFAPIVQNESINKSLYYMKNLKGMMLYKNSPLAIDPDKLKANGIRAQKLFDSSRKSWLMEGQIVLDPYSIHVPEDSAKKSFPLAYVLEGGFSSYFDGKEKPNGTQSDYIAKGKPGKIFLIGSSEVIKNNLMDEEGYSPNAIFVMNVLDYLNNNRDFAIMRSKSQKYNPLNEVTPGTRSFVKVLNIAILPLLVVASGMIILFLRSIRRKKLEAEFKKKK